MMGARLYLPAWGQFTAIDIAAGGNANPYAYPFDPINSQDPTGQWGISLGAIGNAVGKATKAVANSVSTAAVWAYNNRSAIATSLAAGLCIAGAAICVAVTVTAFAVRAEQRIQEHGFTATLAQNLEDGLVTSITLGHAQLIKEALAGSDAAALPGYATAVLRAKRAISTALGAVNAWAVSNAANSAPASSSAPSSALSGVWSGHW